MMKKKIQKIIIFLAAVILIFCIVGFVGIAIAHNAVFCRADYNEYNSNRMLLYNEDIDKEKYPRETLSILSGETELTAYLYGAAGDKGLIIVSPGHRDCNDIKLYEILPFVDAGFKVICYDYTGCYMSEGVNMVGYTQSVYDLDSILTYVEECAGFNDIPIFLFGHSLGGYASGCVLQFHHRVERAIIASPLNTAREQWQYSVQRFTGIAYPVLRPLNSLYISIKYGNDAEMSVIDGINSVDIPVLMIGAEDDEFYGGINPVYKRRNEITNKNCTCILMNTPNHNGHYDYFLTDDALKYQEEEHDGDVDKMKFMEHDMAFMQILIDFLLKEE